MRVECEVKYAQVEINGRAVDGVEVSCVRCDNVATAAGDNPPSVRRALCQLRDTCPRGENNFYAAEEAE